MNPDRVTKFRGMAVKLGHGVAISWDRRVIQHCTSVSHPDWMECARAGKVKDSHFCNHLYGTFTAAKERIVWAGRVKASASGYLKSNAFRPLEKGRACKRINKRRRRSRKKGDCAAPSDTNKDEIVVVPVAGPAVGFFPRDHRRLVNSERNVGGERGFRAEKREQTDGDRTSQVDKWKQGVGDSRGIWTPASTGRQSAKYAANGDCWLVEEDLDVSGRYKIPRKRKQGTEGNYGSSHSTCEY
jgi:hypothetical protein